MNLNEIKIVIIEDKKIELCAIRRGLSQLMRQGTDRINEDNIVDILIREENDLENVIPSLNNLNPDILFIDLHLVNDIDDGINILKNLISSYSELKYLPKYIISSADKVFPNILQFAYPIMKPDLKKLDGSFNEQCNTLAKKYHQLFEATHQLNETLPIMAGMYRAIKEKFDINSLLTNIEYKIDLGEITNEQIIGTLQTQSSILERIKITTADIKERTQLIEIITKATAKALPKITDKEKAKKLVDEWKKDDNLKNALGDNFPEIPEGFFIKMKDLVDGVKENAAKDIGEVLYGAAKEYIMAEASIDDDDTKLEMLTKYSAFFVKQANQLKKLLLN